MLVNLRRVRLAASRGIFSGPDWLDSAKHLSGVAVGRDGRVLVDESTANPLTQLLYLAMTSPADADLHAVLDGPDADVYDLDWASTQPGFRDRMREALPDFEYAFQLDEERSSSASCDLSSSAS